MALCLVIMPFRDELESHFKLIEQCGSNLGLDVKRVDTYEYSGNILQAIWKALFHADLIVADLSYANPNVVYEIAVAQCLGKKVLLLTNDINTIPFDLRSYRVELIDADVAGQADRLRQAMRLLLDASYVVGPLGKAIIYGQNLFLRRVAAFVSDSLPLVAVLLVAPLFIRYLSEPNTPITWAELTNLSGQYIFIVIICYFFIYVPLSTWKLGGTLGQRMLDLKVVTMDGDNLPFWKSLGRSIVAGVFTLFTWGTGFFWSLRGPTFRAFHDIASQTMVVRRQTSITWSKRAYKASKSSTL
ncbi:MAG: RDD family protein [Candidatus Methanomethylicus sp.]|nr:RDD family protein [Candidatus Methanomethylicus sp.]